MSALAATRTSVPSARRSSVAGGRSTVEWVSRKNSFPGANPAVWTPVAAVSRAARFPSIFLVDGLDPLDRRFARSQAADESSLPVVEIEMAPAIPLGAPDELRAVGQWVEHAPGRRQERQPLDEGILPVAADAATSSSFLKRRSIRRKSTPDPSGRQPNGVSI